MVKMRKKILLCVVLLLSSVCAMGQEFKVAGCYKWQSYASCKRILDERFNGGVDSYQRSANEITYYDVRFGGVDYDVAQFGFGQGHLETIEFYSNFDPGDVKGAKSYREYVLDKVADAGSYGIDKYINDDGFKCYKFPIKFKNGYQGPYSGTWMEREYGCSVEVRAFRSKNKEGKNRIFVGLFYEFNPWKEDDI